MQGFPDSTKHYRTRRGHKVTVHEVVLKNSIGEDVTFPVKCSIREDKKHARSRYAILTIDGRGSVLMDQHPDDIVGLWDAEVAA